MARCRFCHALGTSSRGRPRPRDSVDGWLDAVHPDDRAASDRRFAQANATQSPFAIEYRLRRHDGAYRWADRLRAAAFRTRRRVLGLRRLGHRHHRAQADRARGAPRSRAARDLERYRAGVDLLRRRRPLLRHLQRGVLEVVRVVARGNRRSPDARRARCRRLARRRPAHREGVRGRAVGVRSRGQLSPRRQALHPRTIYAAPRRHRRHRRRRMPRHGHHGAHASLARARAARRGRRLVRGRDRQQDSRRHHHDLESGRRQVVRLQRRGSRRAARYDADSGRAASRGGEDPRAHPQWRTGRAL